MDTMPQYYPNDNMSMSREPSSQLSPNLVQPELSQLQTYTPMTDTGYPSDQFGMQGSVPVSEPPPYDEFTGYNWVPAEIAPLFPSFDNFGRPLLDSNDEDFIFRSFLDNIEGNPTYIFNPTLPINMPTYPSSSSSDGISNSMHPIYDDDYSQNHPQDILSRHQIDSSNSTTLSPRTSNITISSPKHSHHEIRQSSSSSQLISPISDDKDKPVTPSVPAKRKPEEEDNKNNRRRPSNPRLSPINTKLTMTQSNSSTSSPRPLSPSMQLSNLSINSCNINNNSNDNENDNDESPGNTPSSSNNCSPSPRTPNRELSKNDDENSLSNLAESESNDNGNNTDDYVEIKSESKPTPQKSSRKPYKELLTEEEKRANHIASEQKRRNTIRAGFKELTDIIPTLKNVNNSKSTILFKAVDYIKYLERRNRNLKERAGLLEMRVEMEMRQGKRYHHHGGFGPAMGFSHQRVGPMQMGNGYGVMPNSLNGMNSMQIPIGPGHTPQQTHVIAPPMQNIYFVSAGADNQPMTSQQQILSAGGVVSSNDPNR